MVDFPDHRFRQPDDLPDECWSDGSVLPEGTVVDKEVAEALELLEEFYKTQVELAKVQGRLEAMAEFQESMAASEVESEAADPNTVDLELQLAQYRHEEAWREFQATMREFSFTANVMVTAWIAGIILAIYFIFVD